MSRRHIKKVFGTSDLAVASSDEEYEPQCTHASNKTNAYAGLEIESSKSDSEDYETVETTSDEEEIEKKAKKDKSKANQSNTGKADDIDQLVSEVNAMLGEPSTRSDPVKEDKPNSFEKIFSLRKKHLNVTNEIKKLLGPDESEGKKSKRHQKKPKDLVRNPITPLSNYPFKEKGLTMHVDKIQDGITYFSYCYNMEYLERHNTLLRYLSRRNVDLRGAPVMDSINTLHVEGMIVAFKVYCEAEDYTSANNILEKAIAYLQYVADPLFNVTNRTTRLEYRFVENRAFHIAILIYSHMLSNKSCHRTALELLKMLLNLDPSDPLGVIFILDVFAIRAREYSWLIEAIDFLNTTRAAKLLVNIKYSYALAHFHVLNKQKEDLKLADDLLKDALVSFPSGLKAILSNGTQPKSSRAEKIISCNMFAADESIWPVRDAVKMYALFVGVRFREPPVLEWLLRNAEEIIEVVDGREMKEKIALKRSVRWNLYGVWPPQICRHLHIIKPMSNLILDGFVPYMPLDLLTPYFNPQPY